LTETAQMKRRRPASGRALLLLVVAAAMTGIVLLLVLKSPDRATEFAPGYTTAAFARVNPGVHAARVLELLGEPLAKTSEGTTESWYYALPKVSPDHMSVRCVVIDARLRTVLRVDNRTRFDYFGQFFAGGDGLEDQAYGD